MVNMAKSLKSKKKQNIARAYWRVTLVISQRMSFNIYGNCHTIR